MRKPGESTSKQVDRQRVVRQAERIDPHVELTSSEQHRVQDVSLANVALHEGVSAGGLPLRDVTDLAEDEDPATLTFGGGLHDPQGFALLFLEPLVLLVEYNIFARHEESGWQEVVLA